MKLFLFCHHHPDSRAQVLWKRGEIRPLPLCWDCTNERLKELNNEAHNGESSSKETTREINHRRDSHPDTMRDDVRALIQHTAV